MSKNKRPNSGEMLNKFMRHHHFSWCGDPIQSTTYATVKKDIYRKIVSIIDQALAEVGTKEEDSHVKIKIPKEWNSK